MKLVNFRHHDQIRLGIQVDEGIIDVQAALPAGASHIPTTMEQAIAAGQKGLANLAKLITSGTEVIPVDKITFAPCVTNPEKILCVGLNYRSHAEECNSDIPQFPVLFSKFNNALAAHQQTIRLPRTAYKFDYEAELVVIMGKDTANVSKEEALSHVFGYTVGNDLSARDLQMRTGQWLLGKTCDYFAPIGPYLVTADEVGPDNLDIRCEVNGVLRQSSNTSKMIFDCATIVSYISQYMTLRAGDLIFTGTPHGVIMGYPEAKQHWLQAGDEVKVSIEKLGTLTNSLA